MKSKYSKSLLISIVLHLGIGLIGFFYWFGTNPMDDTPSIEALFVQAEKPKPKRIPPPKRPQVQRKTTRQVSEPKLKILTSNQPATYRGIVSAAEPTEFQPVGKLNLAESVEPMPTQIEFQEIPRIQRGVEQPIKKQPETETRYKSRLVKFIEAQPGPQSIVYCVDLSNSMQDLPAHKLKKIIDLMRNSLTFLEPHDRFNIMAFSAELVIYQKQFVPVTAETVTASAVYLANITSHIHTDGADHDMLTALTETAKTAPTIVVLFSDGIPTSIAVPNLTLISRHAEGNGQIFAMSIGMAPDFPGAVMLKQLATVSKGDFWLVDR